MAVALSLGGSGFPFFAPCAFEYLKGTLFQDIKVTIGEVADWETNVFLEKVIVMHRMETSLWHWANFIEFVCLRPFTAKI